MGNLHTQLKHQSPPYPADRIQVWDWTGVDITRESQKAIRQTDSVQYRVIQVLMQRSYAVIFDDDGAGGVADVVGIAVDESSITVDLFHCKYSHGQTPGARVADLYEVCGQAQKCVRWMENPVELIRHLLGRNKLRKEGTLSRFQKGDSETLFGIEEMTRFRRTNIRVHIVQPGLSKYNQGISVGCIIRFGGDDETD